MADFYDALDYVLENKVYGYGQNTERPYTCDPGDPTHYGSDLLMGMKWGISAKAYASYASLSRKDPTRRVPIRRNDIRKLEFENAAEMHLALYWNPILGDEIESQPIANCLIDAFYHIEEFSIYILQCLCNCYGCHLKIDGIIGKRTIRALNAVTKQYEASFYNRFNFARKQFFLYLFGQPGLDPSWEICFQYWGLEPYPENETNQEMLEGSLVRVGRSGGMVGKEKIYIMLPDVAMGRDGGFYTGVKRTVWMVVVLVVAWVLLGVHG